MNILKHFDGFQLRGHKDVEVNINGKAGSYCVPWTITGNKDKIEFSIYNYQEEIPFETLERIAEGETADGETDFVRDACERYVVNTACHFLNSTMQGFVSKIGD